MENKINEEDVSNLDTRSAVNIEVGAVIDVLGGIDNIDVEASNVFMIELVKKYNSNNPEDNTIDLPIVGGEYLENYGVKWSNILNGIIVLDLTKLNSVMDVDQEEGRIKSLVRCINSSEKSVSVVMIENLSFEETFNKWFTLNKHMLNMLNKQNQLNNATNGENWISGVCKNGKPINWFICMLDELHELLNSTPWKHWKEGEFDYKNIFTEAVDIYHFLLAAYIEDVYYGLSQTGIDLDMSITEASKYERFGFIHFCQLFTAIINVEKNKNDADVMDMILLDITKHYVLNGVTNVDDASLMIMIFNIIFTNHSNINKSTDDFIIKYYAKNTLNQFRQDNGYGIKDGGYIKIWNGQEDNVVLDGILETVETVDNTEEVIYNKLTELYKEVK